jgi:adenylate cyclase
MGQEIERKFLVTGDGWRAGASPGADIRQGYMAVGPPVAVRVRLSDGAAILNIKKATLAITRSEYEYPIPASDAEEFLAGLCQGAVIEKTRYKVPGDAVTWEVDVFHGANEGLVVAEVELASENQAFARPAWLGPEVSGDPRYLNTSLCLSPYRDWPDAS